MRYFLLFSLLSFCIIATIPFSASAATHTYAVPSPNCVSVGNQPCSHTVSPSPGSTNSVSPGSTSPGSPSSTQTISGTPSTNTTSPSPSTTPCSSSTSQASVSSQSTGTVHSFAKGKGGKKHYSGKQGFLQQFFLFFWQLLQLIFQKLGIQLPNITIPCGSGSGSPASPSSAPSVSQSPTSSGSGSTTSSAMIIGINLNGFSGDAADMAGAVKYVRADLKSFGQTATTFTNAGMKVDDLLQGPYSTSGISGLGNATTWASTALGWYQSDGCNPTLCPIIEVLNEPGGTWFWGSNALSESNASAYDNILIATYNAFKNAYGSNRPILLASFDGGMSDGSGGWGQYMWQANSNIGNYIDGITVHPYDTSSDGLGSQSNVTNSYAQAKSLAGRSIPMYITEIGWQTSLTSDDSGDVPLSGDLLSTSQQCQNVYNYMSWTRSLGYVKAVMLFDYRDDNSDDGTYGIEFGDGVHKPSYDGLKAAAANQTNPCPAS